jgi:hypothetical protein
MLYQAARDREIRHCPIKSKHWRAELIDNGKAPVVQKLGLSSCTNTAHLRCYPYFQQIFIVLASFCFLFMVCIVAKGQVSLPVYEQHGTSSQEPTYNILRFNEDWSFLHDRSLRTDRWDSIKYIPLHFNRPKEYISIGGEFRGTYERVLNDNFAQTPFPNYSFGMQRFQLFADGRINPCFRFFVQFESGLEQGRRG